MKTTRSSRRLVLSKDVLRTLTSRELPVANGRGAAYSAEYGTCLVSQFPPECVSDAFPGSCTCPDTSMTCIGTSC